MNRFTRCATLALVLVASGVARSQAAQGQAAPRQASSAQAAVAAQAQAQAVAAVAVHVDPRVELLTIVARLAEFPEFTMDNSKSPYAERVERRFGKLKKHAAVTKLAALRKSQGVSYDAIPSFAVHLDAVDTLGERMPFDKSPERLDARWAGASSREFLVALRDFAKQSDAPSFFKGEARFYAEVEQRLSDRLSQSKALPWFDAFFGPRTGATYVAIPGLLCGGGNFGVGVRFPDGRPEEITPVFGCWTWDARGLPVFGEQYLPLFIHELCHSYTNSFVDRHRDELDDIGARLYAGCAADMQPQGYGSGLSVLYESLVRAAVVRCRLATEGEDAAHAQEAEEVGHHFEWVPQLATLLGEYEGDRAQWPDFESFMPKVVEYFDYAAGELARKTSAAPQLLSMEPGNGATGVDPSLAVLTFRFDRPMRDGSWSITGATADQPSITGPLAYDAERKVLTVPVKLEPGKSYVFSLNNARFKGFASDDGVPLAPVAVTFTTRN